jgi:predicted MFS family arabinose efflux permease
MYFAMLPMIATGDFQMSGSLLGSCFTASALIQFVASQPAATLSDKFGRKMSLVPSALIIGSSAIAMVSNFQTYIFMH